MISSTIKWIKSWYGNNDRSGWHVYSPDGRHTPIETREANSPRSCSPKPIILEQSVLETQTPAEKQHLAQSWWTMTLFELHEEYDSKEYCIVILKGNADHLTSILSALNINMTPHPINEGINMEVEFFNVVAKADELTVLMQYEYVRKILRKNTIDDFLTVTHIASDAKA
jgi:hypothetical protein